jgi:tRNA (mo5U34)-methyltransferase
MLISETLLEDLAAAGLEDWCAPVRALLAENLREGIHGRLREWNDLLRKLPHLETGPSILHEPTVRVSTAGGDADSVAMLRERLLELVPWRKGPFHICGIDIDSEWRSDMKWARIAPAISPLSNRLVLDVGCGNGYYALRMRGLGARFVLGIDPTLLYVAQFQALQRYVREPAAHVLPVRLADLPTRNHDFDTAFSMGVLYHQRDPLEHLRQLHGCLRNGGELVLETLILPGDQPGATTPPDRYARMRNVWLLPTLPRLLDWFEECGYSEPIVVDVSVTTTEEQRSTEWMPFESLQHALNPDDPRLTVEGLPRPRRALLVSRSLT